MLSLALVAKNAAKRPSEILEINDPLLALDFDTACAFRLLTFENERERDRFKTLAAMLGGGDESESESDETETITI